LNWKARRWRILPPLFTILSLVAWSVAIATSGFAGLVYGSDLGLYGSLILLSAAFAMSFFQSTKSPNDRMMCFAQVILLLVYFQITPLLMGSSQPALVNPLSLSQYTREILATGHSSPTPALFYFYWPGSFISTSVWATVTGLPIFSLIVAAPIFLSVLMILLVLATVRGVPYSSATLALWLLIVGNWAGLTYLGPEGFGLVLTIVLLILVLSGQALNLKIPILLVAAAIAITHPLATLFASTFLLLGIVRRRPGLVPPLLVMLAWNVWESFPFASSIIPTVIQNFFNIGELFQAYFTRVSSNDLPLVHQELNLVRILLTLSFLSLILLSLVTIAKRREQLSLHIYFILACFMVGATVAGGYISGGTAFHGGQVGGVGIEIVERVFSFSLIPMIAILIAATLRSKRLLLVVVISTLILTPLGFVATYGNVPTDNVPASVMSEYSYFGSHATGGTVVEFYPYLATNNASLYLSVSQVELSIQSLGTAYVASGSYPSEYYSWNGYASLVNSQFSGISGFELVYSSPTSELWYHGG
jgi:hypothetical protein